MKLKSLSIPLALIIAVLFIGSFFEVPLLLAQASSTNAPTTGLILSEQELANLIKPSVVRVVTHYKGDVVIKPFEFDFKKLKVVPSKNKNEKEAKIPVDLTISGTGFVVRSDGYIITNSHVISDATITGKDIGLLWIQIFMNPQKYFSAADVNILKKISEGDGEKFAEGAIKDLVLNYATFQGEKNVIVVNSETPKGDKIEDLEKNGIRAKVVAVNNKFLFNERDVALIHIDATDLPAIVLPQEDPTLTVGTPIYITGFPATATFGEKDFTESTFSKGIVSALKDSKDASFKVYQSDAKVSQGSSGSPFFGRDGTVSGIVTFQTNSLTEAEGDNFAFAVPTSIINSMLSSARVQADSSLYDAHFKQGISLLRDRHCEKSLLEFEEAGKTNKKFPVEKYLEPYIKQCNEMITAGTSIDSSWDEYRDKMSGWGIGMWSFVVGAPVAGILLVVGLVVAVRRLRKDESIIKEISEEHHHEEPIS